MCTFIRRGQGSGFSMNGAVSILPVFHISWECLRLRSPHRSSRLIPTARSSFRSYPAHSRANSYPGNPFPPKAGPSRTGSSHSLAFTDAHPHLNVQMHTTRMNPVFLGGLVFEAQRPFYHSALGSRVTKKNKCGGAFFRTQSSFFSHTVELIPNLGAINSRLESNQEEEVWGGTC